MHVQLWIFIFIKCAEFSELSNNIILEKGKFHYLISLHCNCTHLMSSR